MRKHFAAKAIAGVSRSGFPALLMGIALGTALPMQAMAVSHTSGAQDLTGLSIEELLAVEVYSASKFAQKTTEALEAVPEGGTLLIRVAENLTEANGGSIEVQSEAGKGSTFLVTLPTGSDIVETA